MDKTNNIMEIKVKFSEDNMATLDRYSSVILETYAHGGMSDRQREEARSYASEFVSRLLIDNPDHFPHKKLMQEIYDQQRKS